ncbi:hypothetical protein SH668x_001406 [Planctomicrobium sp. SH668]|uniref:hypothetical protein n=1 Tax=Planctomicrobium sp. SH668 TaxID=3448126 RepID=UPI003F5BE39E
MSRNRISQRLARAYIPSTREARRLGSMAALLVLVGLMLSHTSRPESWVWLVENKALADGNTSTDQTSFVSRGTEAIVDNPSDLDPEEWNATVELFRNISDKAAMQIEEMQVYWRLFKWARSQSFEQVESRSHKSPFLTQFWEQTDKSRGKPFAFRLHVRRVLSHDTPENSAGVTKVYELWGFTDESRGKPYVIITDEIPPNFPEGASVRADVYFTGYFLKLLGYEAVDNRRGAPLLIGRVRALPPPPSLQADPATSRTQFWLGILTGGIFLSLFVGYRFFVKSQRSVSRERMEAELDAEAAEWWADKAMQPERKPIHESEAKPKPDEIHPS